MRTKRGLATARREGQADSRLPFPGNSMSKTTVKVVVFHCWFAPGHPVTTKLLFCFLLLGVAMALASHLCYTPHVVAQHQTRVKLNRVFFPR